MNNFTIEQYDEAIEALKSARQQLIDGTTNKGCAVCGGSCDPDYCGHNPLYAMKLCETISKQSDELHDTLHQMAGVNTFMGERYGVARVVTPKGESDE